MELPEHDYDFRSPLCQSAVILSRFCILCNTPSVILVDKDRYDRWILGGEYVQDAFSNLNADQREILVSGSHPACFEKAFPPDEDDDDIVMNWEVEE